MRQVLDNQTFLVNKELIFTHYQSKQVNTKHLTIFLVSSVVALPLGAVKKSETPKQDDAHPVVAAAAISAPRKGSEQSFLLDRATLDILQSDDAQHADAKATLLKDAQKAVLLRLDNIELPLEATQLLKPFVSVRTLDMHDITGSQLPYLPCPKKLECVSAVNARFTFIDSLHKYANVKVLKLNGSLCATPSSHPHLRPYPGPYVSSSVIFSAAGMTLVIT